MCSDDRQKIDHDHGRFRQIVRGKIKQNLRKYISQGEMIGKQGQGHRLHPAAVRSTSRTSSYGDKQQGGVGQGEGDVGDPLGQGDGAAGRRAQAGERRGRARARGRRHARRAGRDPRRGARAAATSSRKGNEKIVTQKDQATPASARTGPESLRHFKRTYKQALQRQIAMGTYDPKNPVIVPIREDRRYRIWKREHAAAVATRSSST